MVCGCLNGGEVVIPSLEEGSCLTTISRRRRRGSVRVGVWVCGMGFVLGSGSQNIVACLEFFGGAKKKYGRKKIEIQVLAEGG